MFHEQAPLAFSISEHFYSLENTIFQILRQWRTTGGANVPLARACFTISTTRWAPRASPGRLQVRFTSLRQSAAAPALGRALRWDGSRVEDPKCEFAGILYRVLLQVLQVLQVLQPAPGRGRCRILRLKIGENEHSRTRKSGRVQKRLQMWRPPLAKGSLGGILPGIFEKYFRLTRRDPAKSIFETSRFLSFFKNLDFSKMWDPEIWQSAREGQKWRRGTPS